MEAQNQYKGKRAVIYLRVSTEEQRKKYGFPAQLSSILEKVIYPLGLVYSEDDVIKDAYTGMEFRTRKELDRIKKMAEEAREQLERRLKEQARRKEEERRAEQVTFVLVMDTLDRLGRKGLQRELYRAELRALGVRILTTDPNEHADDDTLMGEMIRLLHGFKAEQERNDIVRRTVNGKRERVKEGKLLPGRKPLYGYRWGDPEPKGKTFYVYHEEERKVVERMFLLARQGLSMRAIAKIFTEEGIPTPENGKNGWHSSTIERLLKHPFYMGEAAAFRWAAGERRNMKEHNTYVGMALRPEDEQMKISNATPVPPIISPELFYEVQEQFAKKKQNATRNNRHPEGNLLRCGLIKCGYCGHPMPAGSVRRNETDRYHYYRCYRGQGAWNGIRKCEGGTVSAEKADKAAWSTALEIIRDPRKVDEKIEALRIPDPTAKSRQHLTNKITELKTKKRNLQNNLAEEMEKGDMDYDTVDSLKLRIKDTAKAIEAYTEELNKEANTQKKWEDVQKRLNKLHKFCSDMREKIDDPNYEPTYQEKRDAIELFGITVTVLGFKKALKMDVSVNPPSIMSLLS